MKQSEGMGFGERRAPQLAPNAPFKPSAAIWSLPAAMVVQVSMGRASIYLTCVLSTGPPELPLLMLASVCNANKLVQPCE